MKINKEYIEVSYIILISGILCKFNNKFLKIVHNLVSDKICSMMEQCHGIIENISGLCPHGVPGTKLLEPLEFPE